MKIAICGSMSFAKEMLEAKRKLKLLGHKIIVPKEAEKHINGKITDQDKWEKLEFDVFKSYFNEIKNNDAILVYSLVLNNTLSIPVTDISEYINHDFGLT